MKTKRKLETNQVIELPLLVAIIPNVIETYTAEEQPAADHGGREERDTSAWAGKG